MKILVSGAGGFIGRPLCAELFRQGQSVVATVRLENLPIENVQNLTIDTIDSDTDWVDALLDVKVVIHLAARTHVMKDTASDPLAEFRKINVEGTLNLARQAANAGVRRFIFMSSIKVNGENTVSGKPYTADDRPAPISPYALSKREAEDLLCQIAAETAMEVVIIRPTLVYGPGVKANFLSMMDWVNKGLPLPLGAINNKRSLVALDNLVNLIVTCIDHPGAANQTFLVSDDEDLSTTDLLERMAVALGKSARLFKVPINLLEVVAALLGIDAVCQRLCDSLQVDISKTRALLGWTPPISVDMALQKTAEDFLSTLCNKRNLATRR
jgi:nucleoside-diphosphate-sugar epimerase